MASFEAEQLSGLAGEIRRSVESDQFDLAGFTETRVTELLKSAFSTPLSAPEAMVKFTFVVGGGKLVRSRYDDNLTKWAVAALREIGYAEDRSAAETFDSQGTFKQQHDTGQNLKYLIIFPRVACATATATPSKGERGGDVEVLDTKSPEYIVSASELPTFRDIVASKTTSWRQRKKVLKILQDSSEAFKQIEAKLCTGMPLLPREQALYDCNSGHDNEKILWLQNEIKTMADGGQLTASEKDELLATLDANVATARQERAEAVAESKAKRVEKLEEKISAIVARREKIAGTAPIVRRLRHGDEIQRLRLRLIPLLALEEKGRSMSLTMADLKTLEEKSDIEAAIVQLEQSSKGWFEDDAEFALMVANEEKAAKATYAQRQKNAAAKKKKPGVLGGGGGSKSSSGGTSRSSASAWSTIGVKKTSSSRAAGGKSGGQSNAFAYLEDGDSDSD